MQTFGLHSLVDIGMDVILLFGIGVENVISHFLGESPDPVQEVLSGYHSAFKSGQLFSQSAVSEVSAIFFHGWFRR